MTPYDFEDYIEAVTKLYAGLEDELIRAIAKRLQKGKSLGTDSMLYWQVEKLSEARLIDQMTARKIAGLSGKSQKEIAAIIDTVAKDTIASTDTELEEATGKEIPPLTFTEELMNAYMNQTWLDIQNNVNQTLITTNYGTGAVMRGYQDIINRTVMEVNNGLIPFEKALVKTIIRWADAGISSSFIDKGGHVWSMERYVRAVLTSTVTRTYNELRMNRMEEFDVYTVLVSSKPDARPACARCQGHILDIRPLGQNTSGYPSVYEFGYGTPGGHRGIHCRHIWTPFIPGANENHQPRYDEKKAVKRFETLQGQRRREAAIRRSKRNINVCEALKDEEGLDHYHKLLNRQRANLRTYVEKNELVRLPHRERVIL